MHLFPQWPHCTICFLILAKIWIPLLIIQTLYPRIPNFDYDLSELKNVSLNTRLKEFFVWILCAGKCRMRSHRWRMWPQFYFLSHTKMCIEFNNK